MKKNSFLIVENDPNDAFLIQRALATAHPGLVEWIRKHDAPVKDLVIVILTGGASDLQWDAAQKVGAQKVCRKPSRLEELEGLLASLASEYCPEPRTAPRPNRQTKSK